MFGQQLALLDLLSTFFKALVENVRENFNTLRPKPLTSKTPRLLYLLKTNKKKRLLGYLLLFPYFSSHSSSLSFCVEICCISDRDRAKCKFIAEQTFGNPEELVGLFYSQTIGSKKKKLLPSSSPSHYSCVSTCISRLPSSSAEQEQLRILLWLFSVLLFCILFSFAPYLEFLARSRTSLLASLFCSGPLWGYALEPFCRATGNCSSRMEFPGEISIQDTAASVASTLSLFQIQLPTVVWHLSVSEIYFLLTCTCLIDNFFCSSPLPPLFIWGLRTCEMVCLCFTMQNGIFWLIF